MDTTKLTRLLALSDADKSKSASASGGGGHGGFRDVDLNSPPPPKGSFNRWGYTDADEDERAANQVVFQFCW
jgi:hypothetical protein